MTANRIVIGLSTVLAIILASGAAAAEVFPASRILFQDVTATVEVTTTAGSEIEVVIKQGKKYSQVGLSMENGLVTVKGEKWKEEETYDCCNTRIRREVNAMHGRTVTDGKPVDDKFFADYPTIVVSMPRKGDASFVDARMKLKMDALDGALDLDACYVYGEAGDVDSAVIGVLSGSRLIVGNVASAAEIDVSGDADVMTGSAATVDVDIAGTGDVILGAVDGMLDVSIAGSGTVRATSLDGPLTTRIAGSGGVEVKSGKADRLRSTIDGSGVVKFDGTAVEPELRLWGSSEVRLGAMEGRLTRHGSGEVYVAGKLVPKE